jgi:hypothetical protein
LSRFRGLDLHDNRLLVSRPGKPERGGDGGQQRRRQRGYLKHPATATLGDRSLPPEGGEPRRLLRRRVASKGGCKFAI